MARTRRLSRAVALLGASAVLVTGLATSEAATSTGIGTFSALAGSRVRSRRRCSCPGRVPPGRDDLDLGVRGELPSGSSTWFGANTPPGQVFGSSRNAPYLNLRPAADNAASPSVTRYSFASPVPVGCGIVLGDIDSDKVTVSATLADGSDASVAQLGFRGVFNPCSSSPIPSGCSGPEPKDSPTWDPADRDVDREPDRSRRATEPAVGSCRRCRWRTPDAHLAWRTGFPVYQTWFASVARDVTGTVGVVEGDCDVTATTLSLLGADGSVLATTHPQADGSLWLHPRGRLDASACAGRRAGAVRHRGSRRPRRGSAHQRRHGRLLDPGASASDEHGHGRRRGREGRPMPDIVITIAADDFTTSATTDEDGQFTLDDVPPGDYEIKVDPPPGFEVVGDDTVTVTVPEGGGPLDLDFTLRAVTTPTATPTGTSGTPRARPRQHRPRRQARSPRSGDRRAAIVLLGVLLPGWCRPGRRCPARPSAVR